MYSKAYGDFSIVDGTHNMLMYDLKLIPYTNVDCLGKSVITGYCLNESENGEMIKKGLQLFGLANPNATLMSDGGSAFSAVAEETGMIHYYVHNIFSIPSFPLVEECVIHLINSSAILWR